LLLPEYYSRLFQICKEFFLKCFTHIVLFVISPENY